MVVKINRTLVCYITPWEAFDYDFATVVGQLSNIMLDLAMARNFM
jgi:hypothetical protein